MTENEAIKKVKEFGLYHAIGDLPNSMLTVKAFEMAIKALEEIQQYRAIGTVEEIKRMQRYSALAKKHSTIGQVIDSCEEYEAIGTIEECLEARERQRGRKPIIKSKKKTKIQTGDYVDVKCPCCEEDIFSCFHYPPWNDSQKSHKHCENCGQAIDWSETV